MTHSNAVIALQQFRQSVWLDDLRRGLFTSGKFGRLIAEDGLRGVTSNPSIFEKAIAGTTDYAASLREITAQAPMPPVALYEALAIRDIRTAADLLRPVYQATGRSDGFASLESRRCWHTTRRERSRKRGGSGKLSAVTT